jgi:hypothetical protein
VLRKETHLSDVFISYAREDFSFAKLLAERLQADGRDAWVDWLNIPPSIDWLAEIRRAIDQANAFVFVITPDSVTSKICREEIRYAVSSSKRIISRLRHEVHAEDVPRPVAELNWLFLRETDDFDSAIAALGAALDTDLDWVRFHPRLVVRSEEWRSHRGDDSYLLAGSDLENAQNILAAAIDPEPKLTSLQTAYVAESQAGSLARQCKEARGFYSISLLIGVLQVAVVYTIAFDSILRRL